MNYEKINQLILSNTDENKAVAASFVARMTEEEFSEWITSLYGYYWSIYQDNKTIQNINTKISFFDLVWMDIHVFDKGHIVIYQKGEKLEVCLSSVFEYGKLTTRPNAEYYQKTIAHFNKFFN